MFQLANVASGNKVDTSILSLPREDHVQQRKLAHSPPPPLYYTPDQLPLTIFAIEKLIMEKQEMEQAHLEVSSDALNEAQTCLRQIQLCKYLQENIISRFGYYAGSKMIFRAWTTSKHRITHDQNHV